MTAKITIKLDGLDGLQKLLDKFPKLVLGTNAPQDRAVRKAANVLAKRMRAIAPDSNRTGSRLKQSKLARSKWLHKLRLQVRSKLIKYKVVSWSQTGASSPNGNAAHFMQEKPRRMVLWGKATMVQMYRINRNWHTRAWDESKAEMQSVMVQSLKADLDQLVRS